MPRTDWPPYSVERLSEDTWRVAGVGGLDIDTAIQVCEKLDGLRDFEWDFDTHGEARDGLEALKIGESLTVTYPDEDDVE